MPDIFILADAPLVPPSSLASFPFVEMKRAILTQSQSPTAEESLQAGLSTSVEVVFTDKLAEVRQKLEHPEAMVCPLTFNLPDWYDFSGRQIFAACAEVATMRLRVSDWQYSVGHGTAWQPIVLTAKGVLFAEAIAPCDQVECPFTQPLHLGDAQRQPLYELGQQLMQSVGALPGVYLMQFGMDEQQIWFDRLIPFPDYPAIASVGVQTPDLFECHWRCLTQQPIRELSIIP